MKLTVIHEILKEIYYNREQLYMSSDTYVIKGSGHFCYMIHMDDFIPNVFKNSTTSKQIKHVVDLCLFDRMTWDEHSLWLTIKV